MSLPCSGPLTLNLFEMQMKWKTEYEGNPYMFECFHVVKIPHASL